MRLLPLHTSSNLMMLIGLAVVVRLQEHPDETPAVTHAL